MHCPVDGCGGETRVLESRPGHDRIRRRRCCVICGHRFTTYESRDIPTSQEEWDVIFCAIVDGLLAGESARSLAEEWEVPVARVRRIRQQLTAVRVLKRTLLPQESTEPTPDPG